MLARWTCNIRLMAIAAVIALLTGAFFDEHVAYAQGGEDDYVDVGLTLEVLELPRTDERGTPVPPGLINHDVRVIVVNNGSRTAYDVEVVMDVEHPQENSPFVEVLNVRVPVGRVSLENNGRTLRWTIPALGGLQREEFLAEVIHRDPNGLFDNSEYVHEVFGKVTTSSHESSLHKGNNTARVWSYNYSAVSKGDWRQVGGNYTVNVSVDQPSPSPGDTVNFTITAGRTNPYITHTIPGATPPPIDLEVDIELTGGLSVSGAPSYVST